MKGVGLIFVVLALCVGVAVALGQKEAVQAKVAAASGPVGAASAPADDFRKDFDVPKDDWADSGENTYFVLKPGYRLTLTDGEDTLIITVLDETKVVDGVKTRVVEERETKNGQLAEVSRNFFAMNAKTKDVYYFGEEVDEYKDGKVASHGGAWLSGVDGAKFGLMMPGAPKVGDKFYQELAPKVAMDRAKIVKLDAEMTTPAGKYKDMLQIDESSAIEKGVESKYYAPGVGLISDSGFKLSKVEQAK